MTVNPYAALRDSLQAGPVQHPAPAWARIREEARALGGENVNLGHLLWVDRQCVDVGRLHALSPAWVQHFADFYASGKLLDVGRYGVRAAKSDSTCRAIAAEVLLMERVLSPAVVGVCPILSANMREADGRLETLRVVLRACGLDERQRGDADASTFVVTGGGTQARVIGLLDSQGHVVEFRIAAANEASAAGFTGIAGFCDELDLWRVAGANPAGRVLDVLLSRYTTQPQAKLHLMSATYDKESEHARRIKDGDTPLQYVARLGAVGAARDYEARVGLARRIGSTDPLLLAPPLPASSTDVPCWVTNPVTTIDVAYQLAEGNVRKMLSLWGGRPDLGGDSGAEQFRIAREMNERLVEKGIVRRPGAVRVSHHGLMTVEGAPPGDARYGGPGPIVGRTPNWRQRVVR